MKPILGIINAFDVNKGTVIEFSCQDTVKTVKPFIYSNNLELVAELSKKTAMYYSDTRTYRYQMNISDLTGLENGQSYCLKIQIEVDDEQGKVQTYESDLQKIYCYDTPEISFSITPNASGTYNVTSATLPVYVSCKTDDITKHYDTLDVYHISLYEGTVENKYRKIVQSDEKYYNTTTQEPFVVTGLANNINYCLVMQGSTKHNMIVQYEITLYTVFNKRKTSLALKVENDFCNGQIIGSSYVNTNLYKYDIAPTYEDDTVINLKNNTLEYYDGLRLGQDFSFYTEVSDINPNTTFLDLSDKIGKNISISYIVETQYKINPDRPHEYMADTFTPYFCIDADGNKYYTTKFETVNSLTELEEITYIVKFNKVANLINFKITQKA